LALESQERRRSASQAIRPNVRSGAPVVIVFAFAFESSAHWEQTMMMTMMINSTAE
jgi:hypothetical protein